MKPKNYLPFLRAQILAEQQHPQHGGCHCATTIFTPEAHEVHYEREPTFWQRLIAFLKEAW